MLALAPDTEIVDLTHQIEPQNVRQGAFALAAAVDYFPADTIFLAVVDPGVGTDRAALLVQGSGKYYVVPDNGLLTLALQRDEPVAAWRLNRGQFFLPSVSQTFHGRDVFAPIAGHLAAGTKAGDMGEAVPTSSLTCLQYPSPVQQGGTLQACVLYVDGFGNVISNVRNTDVGRQSVRAVRAGSVEAPLAASYQAVPPQQFLSIWGSFGYLELSQSMGNAAAALGLREGSPLQVALD